MPAEDSVIVAEDDEPVPIITPPGPVNVCAGDSITLHASGSALLFNGINQYISNDKGYPFTQDLTYELWLNVHEFIPNDRECIINYNDWAKGYVHFQLYGNQLEFSVCGNNPYDEYFNYTLNADTWYHVAVVYTSETGEVKLYINGVLADAEQFWATFPILGKMPYTIASWSGGRFFNGMIDEIRIWNVARTAAEIKANINSNIPLSTPGLVSYYKMDEGTGTTTIDAKNSLNHPLINNPVWVSAAPAMAATCAWSSGDITQSIMPVISGNYMVTATHATTGCSAVSLPVTVTIKEKAGIASVTAGVSAVCNGSTTLITANGVTGTNATVTWYTESNGNGAVLGTGNILTNVGAGTYYARVTADCGSPTEAFTIVKNSAAYSSINKTICEGVTYAGYTLPGTYIDTLQSSTGCDSIRTLNLSVNKKPVPYLKASEVVCEGDTLVLSPGLFKSYLWQDGSTASQYLVRKAGNYSVSVTNSCGTATTQTVVTNGECSINFPNAFTPNGDGLNDYFEMINPPQNLQNFHLVIYNRWGQKIFETENAFEKWNGIKNSYAQPVGVYTWFCSFKKNNTNNSLRGTLLLLR